MIKLCVYVTFKLVSAIFSEIFIFHQIIALQKLRVLLNLEIVETKGKKLQKLKYLKNEELFTSNKKNFS